VLVAVDVVARNREGSLRERGAPAFGDLVQVLAGDSPLARAQVDSGELAGPSTPPGTRPRRPVEGNSPGLT